MIEQIFLILAFLISCFVFSERPLWGIALMLVFSTRNFYLIEMSGLPTLSLGGKMELQMYDLVLGALLIVTILKVQQRSQKLLFRKSYIVLFIVIFFSFIY